MPGNTPRSQFQLRRSLIFTPGNKPAMFPKALAAGADIVCIDLEDAVAPQHKDEAREKTLALFDAPQAKDGIERMVRINSLRSADGLNDVLAIVKSPQPPQALMLTKVKSPDEVRLLEDILIERGLPGIRLHVIIETNDGLNAAYKIAQSSPLIDSLLFGAVDMAAELRTKVQWETLHYTRSRIVHAAAGAHLDLIDVPFLDLDDQDGLREEARACAAMGFTGKAAIHPKQIPIINEAFSPTAVEIEQARRVVKAFDEADGGLVVIDGKLIEKPVLRSMYRMLAIADLEAL